MASNITFNWCILPEEYYRLAIKASLYHGTQLLNVVPNTIISLNLTPEQPLFVTYTSYDCNVCSCTKYQRTIQFTDTDFVDVTNPTYTLLASTKTNWGWSGCSGTWYELNYDNIVAIPNTNCEHSKWYSSTRNNKISNKNVINGVHISIVPSDFGKVFTNIVIESNIKVGGDYYVDVSSLLETWIIDHIDNKLIKWSLPQVNAIVKAYDFNNNEQHFKELYFVKLMYEQSSIQTVKVLLPSYNITTWNLTWSEHISYQQIRPRTPNTLQTLTIKFKSVCVTVPFIKDCVHIASELDNLIMGPEISLMNTNLNGIPSNLVSINQYYG